MLVELCYSRPVARLNPVAVSQEHLGEIALRGVAVPEYDRAALEPRIVHVGVGGFHRAHLAVYMHDLAVTGGTWGIVGLGMLTRDAGIAAALGAQDHLYTLIEKGAGEPVAAIIGSIIGFVHAPHGHDAALADLVAAPSTAILSLTVTEAGYAEPSPE
jgi:mannitol 2-dehydrogenase